MTHDELIADLSQKLKDMSTRYLLLKSAAIDVVVTFNKPQDYHVWDEALNRLERVLKENP